MEWDPRHLKPELKNLVNKVLKNELKETLFCLQ